METRYTPQEFAILLQRYIENRYSKADVDRILELVEDKEYEGIALEMIEGLIIKYRNEQVQPDEAVLERLYNRLPEIIGSASEVTKAPVSIFRRLRYVAAAAAIILLAVSGWLLYQNGFFTDKQEALFASVKAPATNRASIQLATGEVVYLDSAANGQLAMLGNVKLEKLADGRIVYSGDASKLQYNTLTNPKGSQPIDIGLSDGSHVWLNAGSSVTYPVAFINNRAREVTMVGEAIFKVVHDAENPFRVRVRGQVIEDIGTEFNINAYEDEPVIRTTLIEGVAKVTAGSSSVIVNAGKETHVVNGELAVNDADVEKTIAWRSGQFNFEGADIMSIGRQLGRWYDIEVVYKPGLPAYHFAGGTFMNKNLSEVLKVLEFGGVHFRLEAPEKTGSKARLVIIP